MEDTVDSQTGTAYGLAFSPDGSTLAVATGVGLTVVDAGFKKPGAVVLPPNVGFLSVSWNPAGNQLSSVAGLRNPNIYLWNWDPSQGQIQKNQQYDSGADLYAVSWSPDGNTLIALSEEPTPKIHVWEAATWEKTREIDLPARQPYRVLDWSSDSKSVFEAWEVEGELVLWRIEIDPTALTEVMRLPVGEITYLSVSPDARRVAVADNEGEIRILSIPDGNVIGTIQAAPEPVDIDWHPQGNQLAVLSYRTSLQIWDLGSR